MDDIAILLIPVMRVDEYGNEVKTNQEKQIYCKVRSTTLREFCQAAQAGLRPSLVLTMQGADYNGEEVIVWRGKVYGIIRSYWKQADEIELTLEERTIYNGGSDSSSS